MRKFQFTIVSIIFVLSCNGQGLLDDSLLIKYRVTSETAYFDKANGRYYGCELLADCLNLSVLISHVIIDQKSKKITFDLYIEPSRHHSDTIGQKYYRLFVAKPHGDELTGIRDLVIADGDSLVRAQEVTIWKRQAHIFVEGFKIIEGEHLYISSSGLYKLKEYDLSAILFGSSN